MSKLVKIFDFTASKAAPTHLNLILNHQPFTISEPLLSFIERCKAYSCVDGAANSLYKHITRSAHHNLRLPDAIVGDFDSLKPKVRKFFEGKGVKCLAVTEQDTTDLEKNVNYHLNLIESGEESALLVWNFFGDRIDHFLFDK